MSLMKEEELFNRALELPEDERAAYLRVACGEQEALRQSVERLLTAHRGVSVVDAPCEEIDEFQAILEEEKEERDDAPFAELDGEGGGVEFGDYELGREIARGSMGVVFRATQKSLKRPVAIKLIRSSVLASADEVLRFRAEAEAAASLDHPNIVPIYEIGEQQGQHYFSMRLIEGGTLRDRAGEFRHDPRVAVVLMVKVARAVHAAHQRGIIHRDLKPGNILVDPEGEPHITDFGLAKHVGDSSSMTLSGQVMGSPNYMAPEQVQSADRSVSTAADIYSLGAVLYELLTGVPPHSGESVIDTLRRVVEEEVKPPRVLDSSIARDLQTIVLKCLEKDTERRYRSATELADELERWLRGEPILAYPPSPAGRILRWVCRKPLLAALLGIVALLLLTLGVGGPLVAFQQEKLKNAAEEAYRGEAVAHAKASASAFELRRRLYFADMNTASQVASELGGSARLHELMSKWIPAPGEEDFRSWEWHYIIARERRHVVREFDGHTGQVSSAAWSPDGSRTASGGHDGFLRVWETATGHEIMAVDAHRMVGAVSWSAKSGDIATGGSDGLVRIWQLGINECRATLKPPGSTVAITQLAWGPEGKLLASGSTDGVVRIWDVRSTEILQTFEAFPGRVSSVSWHPDGTRLAASAEPGVHRVWDTDSGDEILGFADETPLFVVAWSPDGKWLAGADANHKIVLVNAASGKFVRRMVRGHEDKVSALSWNPDSSSVASAGHDRLVLTHDVSNGRPKTAIRRSEGIDSVAWSPDGMQVTFCGGHRVVVCDLRLVGPMGMKAHGHEIRSLSWNPEGTRLLSTGRDATVRVWLLDLRDGRALHGVGEVPVRACWSPDGKLIAGAADEISIWEVASGEERLRLGKEGDHEGRIWEVAWAPDGTRLASLGADGFLRIWDTDSGRELRAIPTSLETKRNGILRWSPDGGSLVTSDLQQIIVWQSSDFSRARTIKHQGGNISDLDWNPPGNRLAVATTDGELFVLDSTTGETRSRWTGHNSRIYSVDWHPDGTRLASTGSDRAIRIWDSESGAICLTRWAGEYSATTLEWSSDGKRLASGSPDGGIRIWDTSLPHER